MIYKIGQRRIGNSSRVWRSDLFVTDARSDGGGLGKVRGVHMSGEWRVMCDMTLPGPSILSTLLVLPTYLTRTVHKQLDDTALLGRRGR